MMNRLCTICARGGSKGVQNKNIKMIAGKPLIAHSIEHALASELFDHVVVSTDSSEMAEISRSFGADVFFMRESSLAQDDTPKLDVIRDALIKSEIHFDQEFEVHMDIDATSPLRTPNDLREAFDLFIRNQHDNLFSVTPSRRSPYFNMVELDSFGVVHLCKTPEESVHCRQRASLTYDMNASIYLWRREALLNQKTLFGPNTGIYIMPEERSMDIDSEFDFQMVEFLLEKKQVSQ